MKKNFLVSLCTFIAICVGFILHQDVFAAKTTLNVSPMTHKISLMPGETYTGSISISNPAISTANLIYSVGVGSFNVFNDDYSNISTTAITDQNQIMNWIRFDREFGSVAPNETQIVNFYIDVPLNAPAGGQYATIIVSNDTDISEGDSGNVVISESTNIASIIYANVSGETIKKGAVLDNNIPTFVMSGNIMADSTVKNEGNVHADAEYILQIFPLFSNEEIYTNEENPKTYVVLPETKRYTEQDWNKTPVAGIFRVRQTVRIFDKESITEKMVIKCPIWLLFIIIFAIIALIFWLVMKSKNRKKSAKQ